MRAIHEAIHIPELWPDVLEDMMEVFDARSGSVIDLEVASRCISVGLQDDYIESWLGYFRSFYKEHDTILQAPIGMVLRTGDLIPDEEFLEAEIYRKWCRPQGIRYIMAGRMSERTILRFCRGDGQGQFDEWDVRECTYLLEQAIISPTQGTLLSRTNH